MTDNIPLKLDNRDPERIHSTVIQVLNNIDSQAGMSVREVFDVLGSVVANKMAPWPEHQRAELLSYLNAAIKYNLEYFDETIKTKFN